MTRDTSVGRRGFLRAALAAGVAGAAGCGSAPAPGTTADGGTDGERGSPDTTARGTASPPGTPETAGTPGGSGLPLRLETVATGFTAPLGFEVAPGSDRQYVVDQPGRIAVRTPGEGTSTFLDVRDRVVAGGERGLLGLAFHPDFADDRRLYVRYSAPRRPGTPSGYSHTFVLAEFEATADGLGVRGGERTVMEIAQPQGNHNAGAIAFGPDGYLYVATGDGGAGGDAGRGHAEDWYGANRGGNGQDVTENLLGSVLRIDVDGRDGDRAYAVPDDNPLVGREGLGEHYAWGFRNPWRMSFDGGDLIAGDVGQNAYEEVDVVRKGGNYGWNVKEGSHCYGASSCPDETPDGEALIDPVIEYPHSGAPVSGISVIGGFVYRRDRIPALAGRYVFGDYDAGGRLFAATPRGRSWPTEVVPVVESDRGELRRLLSFGRDRRGRLYALGVGENGGAVHRLAPG